MHGSIIPGINIFLIKNPKGNSWADASCWLSGTHAGSMAKTFNKINNTYYVLNSALSTHFRSLYSCYEVTGATQS